ncbi:MAG: hypothetical protein MJA30_26540, partial [Cytophagales bacterium]|nr:hypothetical protein [Cytophagales bacterium]
MSMFFFEKKENENKAPQPRRANAARVEGDTFTVFIRRMREMVGLTNEEPSTASKQSLRTDEAAYLQYIERSLHQKREEDASHSNREGEAGDFKLLSRVVLTIWPGSDREWKALQKEISVILARKGATSGQEIARLDRLISKIDDWQEKNFGKGRFLSPRAHLDLLKVYWFVKQLQRTLVGEGGPEESLQTLASKAEKLKSGSWLFRTTFTEIKEALENYKHYKQIGDPSNACAMRQQLKQLTTQWLVHAHTQEKVIVSQELRELATSRVRRLSMKASASQDLTPATSPGDLQASKKEFEEKIARVDELLPRSFWNLWGLWGRDTKLEAIQKNTAKIQETLSLGHKEKLIKV